MNTTVPSRRVAVVGGGVTGLVAARRLAREGHDVVVLEAGERVGGHIHTVEIAGRPVDVGAEAVHLLNPAAAAIVDELGLSETVVGSNAGPSWLWTPAGRRALPAGVGPAGPTRLRPVLESGVMSPLGLARAGLEPVVARLQGPREIRAGDEPSVGEFVTSRFGREVTRRFVDPLLGGLHSGDVDRLGLLETAPGLVAAAREGRSLVLRRPAAPASPAPDAEARPRVAFGSWAGGLVTLVDRLLRDVPDVRRSAPVRAIERGGEDGRYRLHLHRGAAVEADAVVVAAPAAAAAQMLRPLSPAAADPLVDTPVARTASVVVGFDRADVEGNPALAGNGLLVPSEVGSLLKAATFLSTKWPHLGGGDVVLVRLSAGRAGQDRIDRLDDAALLEHLRRDLRRFTGLDAPPRHAYVHRWNAGLPQLVVGHAERIARARAALADAAPGVVLAGASYDGVGLTSCLPSGERAAEAVARSVVAADRERG